MQNPPGPGTPHICPYDKLQRKCTSLSDEVISKIIEEISSFPDHLKLNVVLAGVNEPFLDVRWHDIVLQFSEARNNVFLVFYQTVQRLIMRLFRNFTTCLILNI